MPSPIVAATLQAAALSASSNLFAQSLTLYTTPTPPPFSLPTLLRFTLFALLSTPPNYLWQQLLEQSFPSRVAAGTRLSKSNTLAKFALDQLLAAPLNTLAFLYAMGYMQGLRADELHESVSREFWPLTKAGWSVWPLVSLLCFLVVPVNRRVLVGGVVGFAWNVYLGLLAAATAGAGR